MACKGSIFIELKDSHFSPVDQTGQVLKDSAEGEDYMFYLYLM